MRFPSLPVQYTCQQHLCPLCEPLRSNWTPGAVIPPEPLRFFVAGVPGPQGSKKAATRSGDWVAVTEGPGHSPVAYVQPERRGGRA